jgi:hypothetical protein
VGAISAFVEYSYAKSARKNGRSGMKIELTHDQIDEIFITELRDTLANFEKNLEAHLNGRGLCLFAADPADDATIIKKHIKACKRLLEYYGGSVG